MTTRARSTSSSRPATSPARSSTRPRTSPAACTRSRAAGSPRRARALRGARLRDDEIAGFGVADATGTLLAASLLLGEGLGQRSAARTLERAVGRPAELAGTTDTRRFTDAVIGALPDARTDTELFQEVWR